MVQGAWDMVQITESPLLVFVVSRASFVVRHFLYFCLFTLIFYLS